MFIDAEFQQQVVRKETRPLSKQKNSTSSNSVHHCKPKKITSIAPLQCSITSDHPVEDVKDKEDTLAKLKNVFTEELLVFMANKDKMKVDYPPSLSSLERKALHEVCKLLCALIQCHHWKGLFDSFGYLLRIMVFQKCAHSRHSGQH